MSLLAPGVRRGTWVAGSDAPEKTAVRIGFIPLIDCASIAIAVEKGFDKKYGIEIIARKETSWASVRDKLSTGELDAAHVLYGLVYGLHLGVGGPQKDMAVLMSLNYNGQGITLNNRLRSKGVADGAALSKLVKAEPKEWAFAQTFPTGTHAMWLYYWMATYGINPFSEVKVFTVPPPQMVANLRIDRMDGYCVGEPWNARAVWDKIGFTAATSQDIWRDHPEKVLGSTLEFVQKYPNTARAIVAALLDASKYIDTRRNLPAVVKIIAGKAYVDTESQVIEDCMRGNYDNGIGKKWKDTNHIKFYGEGKVNFPYLSDGMWFLTQHKRWGLLKSHPDYLAIARQVNQIAVYKEAATLARVPVPDVEIRTSRLVDGVVWDGKNPESYADGFNIKV
jgi:nitrate/nitrite transport system substrate-binding protein